MIEIFFNSVDSSVSDGIMECEVRKVDGETWL